MVTKIAHITVIIPAFNEGGKIADTIASIKSLRKYNEIIAVDEIIVVDDGSEDNTADIAREAGAKVIRLNRNRGKGAALNAALKECEMVTKEGITVFLDADVGSTGGEIIKIINPIISGECDVAVAKFCNSKRKGGFGLVKFISRFGTKMLTGVCFMDVLSGQRAFKSGVLKNIRLESGFGVEVAMTIDLLNKGYSLKEYEVNMTHSETGRDLRGFIHRGRQMLDIIKVLIKLWLK